MSKKSLAKSELCSSQANRAQRFWCSEKSSLARVFRKRRARANGRTRPVERHGGLSTGMQ